MRIPTRGEQRLAALLSEAAEPMDPVVSPGQALTERARRRTRRRRTAVVAGAMAAVLAIGGSAVWLDQAVRSGGQAVPAGEGVADDRPVDLGHEATDAAREALEAGALERTSGEPSETLVRLLGSPRGHTALTVDAYVYQLEWLWYSNGYRLSWVRPKDIDPGDTQTVPVADWPGEMSQCIAGQGYQARVQDGVPWVVQDMRDVDLAWAARRCAILNQPAWAYADLTREDWDEVYDHLATDWRTCEAQSGSPVYWLIDREEFIEAASRGPLTRRISNLDERLAGSDCPQVPDHLRNGIADS